MTDAGTDRTSAIDTGTKPGDRDRREHETGWPLSTPAGEDIPRAEDT